MIENVKEIFEVALKRFHWVSDKKQYRIPNKWVTPKLDANGKFKGDCEDFVLHCNEKIRELGIKCQPVFCRAETGEGHMVLRVPVEDEYIILDNRQKRVVSLTGLKRQGYTEFFIPISTVDGPWEQV